MTAEPAAATSGAPAGGQYVYDFIDGNKDMKDLLGG